MFSKPTTNGSDSLGPSAAGTCDITFWGDVALRALAILPGQAVVMRGIETTGRDPGTGKVCGLQAKLLQAFLYWLRCRPISLLQKITCQNYGTGKVRAALLHCMREFCVYDQRC
jgi:hypothetical protein